MASDDGQLDSTDVVESEKLGVSKDNGSSILIGFSIINHPFWGTTILGNSQLMVGIWNIR